MPDGAWTPPVPTPAPDGISGRAFLATMRRDGIRALPSSCFDGTPLIRRVAGRTVAVLSTPEAVRRVLVDNPANYRRLPAGIRVLRPIAGRGLLIAEGAAWKQARSVLAPAFAPRALPVLGGHIARAAATFCDLQASCAGRAIPLLEALQALSLEIAGTAMFSLEMARFGPAMRALLGDYMLRVGRPALSDFLLPLWVPTPAEFRRAAFRRRWMRLVAEIIAARRRLPPSETPRDLFDLMRQAYGGGDVPDPRLADEAATMIVAGHETTALALFWSCLLLAGAPATQEALAAEAAALPADPESAAAALPNLPRTRAVLQEALRLYPPAFLIARAAAGADEIGGHALPRGAIVLLPVYALHRHRGLWTEPDRFDPARFLGPAPDRFAYLPFGAGPHTCIGAQLAQAEAVLVLAHILRRLRLERVGSVPVLPVGTLTTRPDHPPDFILHRRRAA